MKPLISIIIPTLNEEKILASMLQSLRTFTAYSHEIIVSDGKSTDKTVEIAQKYADHVVEYKGNEKQTKQTIAHARNLGASIATGEYFLFLDADVFIPHNNEFFTKALARFALDKRLVALGVFLKILPEHATFADRFFFGLLTYWHYFLSNIVHDGAASGEFQMIHANAFKQVQGYNESLAVSEDYNLMERLSKIGHMRIAPELKVFHTSRRAHSLGWPKLLSLWIGNAVYARLFKRSMNAEWKVIR